MRCRCSKNLTPHLTSAGSGESDEEELGLGELLTQEGNRTESPSEPEPDELRARILRTRTFEDEFDCAETICL